jgi:hypothetical protein
VLAALRQRGHVVGADFVASFRADRRPLGRLLGAAGEAIRGELSVLSVLAGSLVELAFGCVGANAEIAEDVGARGLPIELATGLLG